jgi:hypothetical protein
MHNCVISQALNAQRRSSQGLTEAELLLYTETFKYDGGTSVSDSPTAATASTNTAIADSNSSSSSNNGTSSNDAGDSAAAAATTTAAAAATAAAVEEGRSSSIADTVRHNNSGGAGHQTECVICLSDFETGEQMRRLVSHLCQH